MTEKNPADSAPTGELTFHQSEDGRTRIECRFEVETAIPIVARRVC